MTTDPTPDALQAAWDRLDTVFAQVRRARAVNASFARRTGRSGASLPDFHAQLIHRAEPRRDDA